MLLHVYGNYDLILYPSRRIEDSFKWRIMFQTFCQSLQQVKQSSSQSINQLIIFPCRLFAFLCRLVWNQCQYGLWSWKAEPFETWMVFGVLSCQVIPKKKTLLVYNSGKPTLRVFWYLRKWFLLLLYLQVSSERILKSANCRSLWLTFQWTYSKRFVLLCEDAKKVWECTSMRWQGWRSG